MREFKQHMKALNEIDDHSEVGRDYCEKASTMILGYVCLTFEYHGDTQWLSSKTLHYIFKEHTHHAQACDRWLVNYEAGEYSFPICQVTLSKHHIMTHGNIIVNLP